MNLNMCNSCGGELLYSDDRCICTRCGAYKPRGISDEENSLLSAAYEHLRGSDFDTAERDFTAIIEKYPTSASAYWGRLLSKYGILYKEDFDGKRKPSCRRTSSVCVFACADYQKALEYASEEERIYCKEQARYIERLRKRIALRLPENAALSIESDGLNFSIHADGTTCAVTGIGSCGDTELIIPETVDGYRVTEIGSAAFDGCFRLTGVIIPDSVTVIGAYAFRDCGGITDMVIPFGVERIGESAFRDCASLRKISLPKSVTSVGDGAFFGCRELLELNLPEALTQVGWSLCYGCRLLKKVTIPEKARKIGDWAFADCKKLREISLPESVSEVGKYVFANCENLTELSYDGAQEKWNTVRLSMYWKTNSHIRDIRYGGRQICKHIPVTDPAVEPTCTLPGRTQGAHCVLCGEVVRPCSVIPPKGHQPGEWVTVKEATVHQSGLKERKCVVCGETVSSEIIPMIFSADISYTLDQKTGTCEIVNADNYRGSEIDLPETIGTCRVTSIAALAFSSHPTLKTVTVPASVTAIGAGAFSRGIAKIRVSPDNRYFTDVDGDLYSKDKRTLIQYASGKKEHSFSIPSSVARIGALAFADCAELYNVSIPASVKYIDEKAFSGCRGISSLTISDSVKEIGTNAFSGCASLTHLTVGTGLERIGENVFSDCRLLANILFSGTRKQWAVNPLSAYFETDGFPKDIRFLGSQYCRHVAAVQPAIEPTCIREGRTEGRYCKLCGEVLQASTPIPAKGHQPGNWEIVRPASFQEAGLKERRCVICGEKMESLTISAVGSRGLAYDAHSDGETCEVTGIGACVYKNIVIPGMLGGYRVTRISASAFSGCENLRSVVIPDSVTVIGDHAFANCKDMKSILIGEGVESIGISAFEGCESLEDITIPDSVTEIGKGAFLGCESLHSVSIGAGMTSIGESVFRNCRSLSSVRLHRNISAIGEYAFCGCTSLRRMDIPAHVSNIGAGAFACGVSEINVSPEHAIYASVGGHLYTRDRTVLLQYASGKGEEDFYVPDFVRTVGPCAFIFSESLKSVTFGGNVEKIGACAFYASGLTELTVPDSVTDIGHRAFYGCNHLAKATLGGGVRTVGSSAFQSCGELTHVTVGIGIERIEEGAFRSCTVLKHFKYLGKKAQWKAVSLGEEWNYCSAVKKVSCASGSVSAKS